jgi:predicted nuclease of predicted toxin-antitoxin system
MSSQIFKKGYPKEKLLKFLEKYAEKILLRTGNINPKNMNVVISIPLSYAWEVYSKKCRSRISSSENWCSSSGYGSF